MPEIGEVARIVNRLRLHLVGRTISKVHAVLDEVVFKDTTHLDFMKKLEGKKVVAGMAFPFLSRIMDIAHAYIF